MFLSLLPPHSAHHPLNPYIGVFRHQLRTFASKTICYIGSEEYFEPSSIPARLAKLPMATKSFSPHLFDPLGFPEQDFRIWRALRQTRFQPMEDELAVFIKQIQEYGPVEALLTWDNCPSLCAVGQAFNLPVIHNELGPLREPRYHATAYFDFTGLRTSKEVEKRYAQFLKEDLRHHYFSRQELREIFSYLPHQNHHEKKESYDIGIALQGEREEDITFSKNGLDNTALLKLVNAENPGKRLLSRPHPIGHIVYDPALTGTMDTSKSSYEFIHKVNSIVTLYSNIVVEALLYGKAIKLYEDHPFSIFNGVEIDSDEGNSKLNFMLLCYIIPEEKLFDEEYYRWRLTFPTEKELFDYHLSLYTSYPKKSSLYLSFLLANMKYKGYGVLAHIHPTHAEKYAQKRERAANSMAKSTLLLQKQLSQHSN